MLDEASINSGSASLVFALSAAVAAVVTPTPPQKQLLRAGSARSQGGQYPTQYCEIWGEKGTKKDAA